MSMNLDRYAPDVLACWVYWEALRRLGFSPDDIFVSVYHEPVLGFDVCGVILRTQCREFVINAAELTRGEESFVASWRVFGNDVLSGKVSDAVLQPIWYSRTVDVLELPLGLMSKGFTIPVVPQ